MAGASRDGATAPSRKPLAYRLARFWARHAPRAKSAVPRFLGRFLHDDTLTIATESGLKLAVAPSALDVYCWIDLGGGRWDPPVMRACLNELPAGGVFYDIGANVGLYALEAAGRLSASGGRVEAFEPQRALAEALRRSAALNGLANLKVHALALGEREGEVVLHVPAHSIHASLVSRSPRARQESCPMLRLDTLVERGSLPPPDMMKIDVEGSERAVLAGAAGTLAARRPVLLVEADENLTRYGATPAALFERIEELAGPYRFWRIVEEGLAEVSDRGRLEFGNYIARPRGS